MAADSAADSELHSEIQRRLDSLYGELPDSLAFTSRGIWLATPVSVLALAALEIARWPYSDVGPFILDAGAGDGRVLAALAVAMVDFPKVRLVGIECDSAIAQKATEALSALEIAHPPQIIVGDFATNGPFEMLGASFSELDVIVHYPDGNEACIHQRFVRESKSGARLVLLSPQLSSVLREPPSFVSRLRPDAASATWTMSAYVHD